jgi:hypothetical protein
MVRLVIGLLIVGGRRLRHLAYVQDDPLFQRFCEVQVVPTARTASRWLQGFTMTTVATLQAINTAVVARVLATLGVRTWTIDVDGVVVSTGLQVERAFRGFNPHHRKVPSYYPIMAHLAETTHVLRVKNRSGNVHDGKAGLPFLRDLWTQLGSLLPRGGTVRFRMDGAFFRQDVLQWLGARSAGYAIKVPFYRWLDLQQYIRAQPIWRPVAPGITGFVVAEATTPWGRPMWVAIYRKHVQHQATKNYQWDLFDPDDGHYGYSAVTSNLEFTLANLWRFACGRGNHEKTIAQLKTGGLPYGADHGLRGQQRLAASRRAGAQPADELSDRDGRHPSRADPQAHRASSAPDDSDAPLCALQSSGADRPPGGALRLRLTDNAATRQVFTRIRDALPKVA